MGSKLKKKYKVNLSFSHPRFDVVVAIGEIFLPFENVVPIKAD